MNILYIIFIVFLVTAKDILGVNIHYYKDTLCLSEEIRNSFIVSNKTVPWWMSSGIIGDYYSEIVYVNSYDDIKASFAGRELQKYEIGECYVYLNTSSYSFMITKITLSKPEIRAYDYFYDNEFCENGPDSIMAVRIIGGKCVPSIPFSHLYGCVEGDDNYYEFDYTDYDCKSFDHKTVIKTSCDDRDNSRYDCRNLLVDI